MKAAYSLIGSSIDSVEVNQYGRLRMHFTEGVVAELFLSEEDMNYDDSVWEVASENLEPRQAYSTQSVSCVPEAPCAIFFGRTSFRNEGTT